MFRVTSLGPALVDKDGIGRRVRKQRDAELGGDGERGNETEGWKDPPNDTPAFPDARAGDLCRRS